MSKNQQTKEYRLGNEIIQIGATLLDEEYNIIGSFDSYVKPEYGALDSRIVSLTGIRGSNLKDAPLLKDALIDFADFIPEGDVIGVSWSHTDDRQLCKEMKKKGIEIPKVSALFGTWLDCQQTFSVKIEATKAYNLTEALNIANIEYEEGAHDGAVDAHNTALLFAKMQKEDVMELNTYYLNAVSEEADHHLHCDLSYLFKDLVLPEA